MDELRQAIDATKEQQPVAVSLEWYQDTIKLPEIKEFIRANINAASRSFVAIGYYLKYVRDKQLYKEEGYTGVSEFAKAEFGISAAQASKFIGINDRFSVDSNSPVLLEQYKDFSSSKLSEMLYLTDEQLDQVTVATTNVEIREIKNPVKQPDVFSVPKTEPAPSGKCIHRSEFPCTLPEASKIAQGDGEQCSAKCCWNCPKHGSCGYECNSSAHRPIVNDIPEIVNDEPEIVDNESEIVNDVDESVIETPRSVIEEPENVIATNVFDCPCDTCGHEIQGCCDYDTKEDYCVLGNKWIPRDPDPVETVEADIIQTVPEEPFTDQCETSGLKFNNWLKANGSSIADIVDVVLMSKKVPDEDNLYAQIKNGLISRLITKTEAYYSYLTMELGIEPEPMKQLQPDLPILKNNDRRKDFIDDYKFWPIWIDTKETGERYYRYNLNDNVAMVVKVSRKHLSRNYHETKEYEYSAEQYYLLGIKAEWHQTGVVFTVDESRTFYECSSNKSQLVDYLKYFQKKGA